MSEQKWRAGPEDVRCPDFSPPDLGTPVRCARIEAHHGQHWSGIGAGEGYYWGDPEPTEEEELIADLQAEVARLEKIERLYAFANNALSEIGTILECPVGSSVVEWVRDNQTFLIPALKEQADLAESRATTAEGLVKQLLWAQETADRVHREQVEAAEAERDSLLEWARDLATVHWTLSEANHNDVRMMVEDSIQQMLREWNDPKVSEQAATAEMVDVVEAKLERYEAALRPYLAAYESLERLDKDFDAEGRPTGPDPELLAYSQRYSDLLYKRALAKQVAEENLRQVAQALLAEESQPSS